MRWIQLLGVIFFIYSLTPSPVTADDFSLSDLDAALTKERLRKIYGEFGLKAAGEWQVSMEGRTEKWKWTDKGWVCPQDQKQICMDLVPASFRWWVQSRGWLQTWSPKKRVGFDFGNSRDNIRGKNLTPSPSQVAETSEEVEEQKVFEGKKTADEIWDWQSTSGSTVRIYISSRNQFIDLIEPDKWVEHIEWFQKAPGSVPEIERIVLEKDQGQVVFSRVRS